MSLNSVVPDPRVDASGRIVETRAYDLGSVLDIGRVEVAAVPNEPQRTAIVASLKRGVARYAG